MPKPTKPNTAPKIPLAPSTVPLVATGAAGPTVIQPVAIRTFPWGAGLNVVGEYLLDTGVRYETEATNDGINYYNTGSTQQFSNRGDGKTSWSMSLAQDVLAPFSRLVLP